MKPFVIELDDRALSLARDGQVLSSAPSAVSDGGGDEPAGANAWHSLRLHPTNTSTRHLGLVLNESVAPERSSLVLAAELTRRLAEHAPGPAERVWIATPARIQADGLGTALGILRSLQSSVDGFVDSAAACVAALGLERSAIVLELGLHHAAATSVDRDGAQVRRRRTALVERGGLLGLHQAWLDFISKAMVKRTRFDPLHDAATEQQLFDSLEALAREAAAGGSTTAALTQGAERFEVTLSRDEFAQAGQPIYREVSRLLHELRPAGAPVTFVIPARLARLPGLREELEQFAGCDLVGIPDGFAAAAISLLDLPERSDGDLIRLLRRLPANGLMSGLARMPHDGPALAPEDGQPSVSDGERAETERSSLSGEILREPLGRRRVGGPAPSHVLLDGHAYSLSGHGLVVGRSPGEGRSVTLPEGLAGVSRRHCTFLRDGEHLVLLDHSSFGTFVNGERVAERVRVYPGDRVRVGEPGVELVLIAVGEAAAATV